MLFPMTPSPGECGVTNSYPVSLAHSLVLHIRLGHVFALGRLPSPPFPQSLLCVGPQPDISPME